MTTRHKDYYFEDVIFQVENQLFKVPRHLFLQESEIFRDIFSCPVPTGARPDGLSDDQPLHLGGIAAKDFVLLLRCLYPILQYSKSPQMPTFETAEEWEAVLELAALQAYLGRKHHVREWVLSAFNKLIQRAEPLSKEEIEMIGLDDGLKVMAIDFTSAIRQKFNL